MTGPFWSAHTHSAFSTKDALPLVPDIVTEAVALGYPALALTDHGNMSGTVQLYTACRKAGIEPLPGIELYTTSDISFNQRKYQHLTVMAYSEAGYRNLCKLATLSAKQSYYRPRVDWANFALMHEDGLTEGLAVGTACYFGAIVQTMLNVGFHQAAQLVQSLAYWFPKVFVELQNHGIADEAKDQYDDAIVEELIELANHCGVPYIITQDSHYLREDQREVHDYFKTIMSWSDEPEDAVFPGEGGYHMVDATYLGRFFEPDVLETALDNLTEFAIEAKVRIPELDNFSLKVPDVTLSGNAQRELEEFCRAFIDTWTPEYKERLESELAVIDTSQVAGLLLCVKSVCDWMRQEDIWFHARGSASGSLVCMVLGITQIDPVKWGLRFDRFLSTDRTRPPDIDLDVEHRRRSEVEAMLADRFSIVQVGTHRKYSIVATHHEDDADEYGDEAKGSLMVGYHSSAAKRGLPRFEWRDLPDYDKRMLRQLADMKLIEGFGTHAAGYVIAPDDATLAQLPQSYIASSKRMISAYAKKDVEKAGFVKLDVLGLRDITAFRVACESADLDPADIPLNDPEVFRRIAAGRTQGVFQLQGFAMMKGCERMKPKNLDDIVAAQALFRPATMKSGATSDYMERRFNRQETPQMHPDIMAETAETRGVLLFQEQVIGVLRRLRMPPAELTDMLDNVKASNEYVAGARAAINTARPRITELAEARGWGEGDISWLLSALEAFADYSFNKAHAAQYGVIAYRSAWLSLHRPLNFWLGAMTAYQNHEKEPNVVRYARLDRIRIMPAHVNRSGITPVIDGERIRRGLLSVRGVGVVAAQELASKAPFASLRDLGERVVPKKVTGAKKLALGNFPDSCGGTIEALNEAGALDDMEMEA